MVPRARLWNWIRVTSIGKSLYRCRHEIEIDIDSDSAVLRGIVLLGGRCPDAPCLAEKKFADNANQKSLCLRAQVSQELAAIVQEDCAVVVPHNRTRDEKRRPCKARFEHFTMSDIMSSIIVLRLLCTIYQYYLIYYLPFTIYYC